MAAVSDKIYGARTIKRERRTAAQIEQLDNQILAVLGEDHPQSVRHVFYRMTNPRLSRIPPCAASGKRTAARGKAPIQLDHRRHPGGYFVNTYSSAGDFLRSMNLLPTDALAVAKAAEQSERAHIERMAQIITGGDL